MPRVGINGFAGLTRSLIRIAIEKWAKQKGDNKTAKIVLINEPKLDKRCMTNLIKFDTMYGRYKREMREDRCGISIEDQRIQIIHEEDCSKIKWKEFGVDYVIDTVNFTQKSAAVHLKQGVKVVLVTGCTSGQIPELVVGVNHDAYNFDMKIVSPGSPSLNCLIPLLQILYEHFTVEKALVTGLYPPKSVDHCLKSVNSSRTYRSHRNYILTESSTPPQSVCSILPGLQGKYDTLAFRLCTHQPVGAIDLSLQMACPVKIEDIQDKIREASMSYMKGIVRYRKDEIVSGDVIGDPNSCVVDAAAMKTAGGDLVKILAYQDNRYAYAYVLLDLLAYISSRQCSTN